MGATAGTFIPKVFDEHLESVGLVWTRRLMAIRSADYAGADISELDDLIEAHFEGLAAAGEDAIPLLEDQLHGDDPLRVFAGASALLRVGTPEALSVVHDEFSAAKGKKLDALRDALAHGPSAPLNAALQSLFLAAPPSVSAAAGAALAFHNGFAPSAQQLERLILADEPSARAGGWCIAAYCRTSLPSEWYEAGLRDEDADVRRAALQAAAWNASPTFYPYCHGLAAEPNPDSIDALVMLAGVAPPQAYQLIELIAANSAAGPGRFRVVGAFGHPYFIDLLIREIDGGDPDAAAAAFEKMTGRRVADADEARKVWRELAPQLAHSARICRGIDVSQPVERRVFALLDRESAWEFCLRARLTAGWPGTPLTLERFPQRG